MGDGGSFTLTAKAPAGVLLVEKVPGDATTKEVQVLSLANAASGTFTLTFGGNTSASIAYSATPATLAANIAAQLNAAPVSAGVTVTAGANGTYDITFNAVGAQGAITASAAGLATNLDLTTGNIAWSANDTTLAANIQAALNAKLATVPGAGTATVEVTATGEFDVTFSSGISFNDLTSNIALLTGTGKAVTVTPDTNGVLGRATQSLGHDGDAGVFRLTYAGQTTGMIEAGASAADVRDALLALQAVNGLSVSGTGTVADPYVFNFTDATRDTVTSSFHALTVDSSTLMRADKEIAWTGGLVVDASLTPNAAAAVNMVSIEGVQGGEGDD
ncbi:MAG: hypothetical protein Q7V62_13515, partial [Actinomycetota bacterium]|nr:hypothetical protein [Actinomycetota bacterium]